MTYERDAYMRRQEEDHDMIRMRQPRRVYNSTGCADAMCADAERDAEANAPLYAEISRLRGLICWTLDAIAGGSPISEIEAVLRGAARNP